jgi:hypothetical protein
MSELTEVVDRIRQNRRPLEIPEAVADVPREIVPKPYAIPPLTPPEARAAFAGFPPAIQAAMKAAAPLEGWTPAQWVDETFLVADLLQQPDHSPAVETALLRLYAEIAGDRR